MVAVPAAVSMAIPFAVDDSGLVATEQAQVAALSQRVTALASTQPGERVMAVDFGVDTAALLFNATGDQAFQVLGIGLTAKMRRFEPGAELTGIRPLLNASGSGVAAVVATARPVAGTGASSSSATVIVRADGTVVTLP